MPYLRWLSTLHRHAHDPAVYEEGRITTFADLADLLEQTAIATGPVIARSGGVPFLVEILRGWRDGQAVIPAERDAPAPALSRVPPPDTVLVKYTPGATGIPRGIFFTGPQLIADGDRLVKAMGLSPAIPNLAVISLAHSYGFSNVVLPLLLHGVPVHFAPVPFPRAIEEIFRTHESLALPAVPSMWRAWHRAGILKGAPLSLALSAGAPLALALENEVHEDSGLKIRNFYGTSECGGISLDLSDVPRSSAGIVGTVLPGVTVSTGKDGRFLVESDAVATGYDSAREDDILGDGVYLTRDMGMMDSSGILHLTGTVGGAINVAGRKVSPTKVEAALMATGLVARVKVSGTRSMDPERHEEISAAVELCAGITLDALKSAACDRLQAWEMPRHWQPLA